MVWASNNFLSGRIRLACPVMELFHPYKKILEDTWRKPEFFYTLFAPLAHSFHPNSPVKRKPKLKEIESYVTILRLLWPEFRAKYYLLLDYLEGSAKVHLRNILLVFEFFIPIVSFFPIFRLSRDYRSYFFFVVLM